MRVCREAFADECDGWHSIQDGKGDRLSLCIVCPAWLAEGQVSSGQDNKAFVRRVWRAETRNKQEQEQEQEQEQQQQQQQQQQQHNMQPI